MSGLCNDVHTLDLSFAGVFIHLCAKLHASKAHSSNQVDF